VFVLVHDALEDTESIALKSLPVKNIALIFVATFLLVFVLFTMVEPELNCPDTGRGVAGCRFNAMTGDMILGILIAGVLFLFDMLILYMTLSEYFM